MRWLSPEEQKAFREEFREIEREIQRYIGVYLSGLVLIIGWIIGPQSRPLIDMALGNNGHNMFGLLLLAALNALFTSFLIYKSLSVHEVTQFVTVLSTPDSAYTYWEHWHRSRHSATKDPVSFLYFVLLTLLPVAVSALIMTSVIALTYQDPQTLSAQLKAHGTTVAPQQLELVFWWTYRIWFVVLALHVIPLFFLWVNIVPTRNRWKQINELCSPRPLFEDGRPVPLLPPSSDPNPKIQIFTAEGTAGEVSEQQMIFLLDHLLQKSAASRVLNIDRPALETLTRQGMDVDLRTALETLMGKQERIELRW